MQQRRLCQPACCIDGRPLLRTDKLCPGCCAVTAGKYAVGENKADQQAKLYEGVTTLQSGDAPDPFGYTRVVCARPHVSL